MTENTMNKTSNTPAADLPPVPNGHGTSNGTKTDETHQADTAAKDATKHDASSKKNKKKKKGHRHHQKPASAQGESTAAAATTTDQPAPTDQTEPTATNDPQPPIDQPPAPLIAEPAAAPIEQPAAAPIEPLAAAPIEEPAEPIIEQPAASLRLRMKVWTDPTTAKRYLMPSAFMRDVVNGQPVSDVMYAYAMRDDDTKLVTLTAGEWNALPFFYFQEDGPAPRAASRPVDDVAVSYTKTS